MWIRVAMGLGALCWAVGVAGCDGDRQGQPPPADEAAPAVVSPPEHAPGPEAHLDMGREDAAVPRGGGCSPSAPQRCFAMARKAPLGTPPSQLVRWLQTACDGDVAAACLRLGQVLERGAPGVPADVARGRDLIQRACRGGSQAACDQLGH